MTFNIQETTREGGNPVELFLFELNGTRYPYCNQEDDLTIDGIEYLGQQAISRSALGITAEGTDENLTVVLPADNLFIRLFIDVIPGKRGTLQIRQFHRTDLMDQTVLIFDGFVSTVNFTRNLKQGNIVCRSLSTAAERETPRFVYSNLCNHDHYGSGCTLSEADYEELTLTISTVAARVVTIAGATVNVNTPASSFDAPPEDYWVAGFIQIQDEFRLIIGQSGRDMTLNLPFRVNAVGLTIRMLPGCKHRRNVDCDTKYGNAINYGGFPLVPTKNPFESLE